MNKKLLFNPVGDDTEKRLIKGDTTNIFDLYNIKYKWAIDAWDTLLGQHWLPEKVSMVEDKLSYKQMTDSERDAYLKILSFLIFLDSIQTNNISNIADYITAPEVTLALSRQQFDEAIHSKSYGHILTSIFDKDTAMKAIYYWRDDKILLERNSYIANIYQDFINDPTDRKFVKVVIANYLLEGIYFYNGFNFFYNLSSRGFMTDTANQIKYINRDELMHCVLFGNIIKTLHKEEPELMKSMEEEIYEMFKTAVEQEIKFSRHAIKNILGITDESIEQYTHYIANKRLRFIGLKEIFDKVKNPYNHLELMAGIEDQSTNKAGNFETTGITYVQSNLVNGWDKL